MAARRSAATDLKTVGRLDPPDSKNGGLSQSSVTKHKIADAIVDRVASQRLLIIPFTLELLGLGIVLLLQKYGRDDRKLIQNPQRSSQG